MQYKSKMFKDIYLFILSLIFLHEATNLKSDAHALYTFRKK